MRAATRMKIKKKTLWPFDDFQPVGFIDLVVAGIFASAILWPESLGLLQWGLCLEGWPHPMDARFFRLLIVLLVLNGAFLGFFCTMVSVVGDYYKVRWLHRFGPYVVGACLSGAVSWWLPEAFRNSHILWRPEAFRVFTGALTGLPAAWATIRIARATSKVHPYRESLRKPAPDRWR